MPKDFWDKFKISSDSIASNKWLLLFLFAGASSVATNAGQFISGLNVQADNEKAIHEVAAGFQSMMVAAESEPVKCGSCAVFILNHKKKDH